MDKSDQHRTSEGDPAFGRRSFMRHSLVSIGATVQEFVKHRDAPTIKKEDASRPAVKTWWLRPPGAVTDHEFLERCTKCGDCIDACPHTVIRKLSEDDSPAIFPEERACRLCDDFPCIAACETDALLPIESLHEVHMGLAMVSSSLCTAGNGCNACVSQCPMDALSMDFGKFSVNVDDRRCVGCGLCQYTCRTVNDRVAIRVVRNT